MMGFCARRASDVFSVSVEPPQEIIYEGDTRDEVYALGVFTSFALVMVARN